MSTRVRVLAWVFSGFLAPEGEARQEDESPYLFLNEQLTPRANGFSGAFVALADDFGAGLVNPAGLTRVPRFFEGTFGFASSGRPDDGETLALPQGVLQTPVGAAFRHCAFTLGFSRRIPFEVQGMDVGGEGEGSRSRLDTWSFFAAWQASKRLSIGLTVNESSFRSDSTLGLTKPSTGGTDFTAFDEVAMNALVGLGLDVTERDRVGVAFRSRQQWAAPTQQDPSQTVGLIVPARLTVGYARALAVSDRFTVSPTAQIEWHDSYDNVSALGGRLGLEVSFPIGRCWSGCGVLAQLRAGWAFTPRDAVLHLGALPTSLERKTGGAFGGSLSFDTLLPMRVDVSASDLEASPRWSVALSIRYGVSFRDVNRR